MDIKEKGETRNMWDFDEKAFDQFIIKKFNLKPSDEPETEKAEKETEENLNEAAALSEALTESLNTEPVVEYEHRDLSTYTYDYQMMNSVNISPNKQSIFSDKPKLKDSKHNTKGINWTGEPKEGNDNEMKVHVPSSNSSDKNANNFKEKSSSISKTVGNTKESSSSITNNPSSTTRGNDGRFSNSNGTNSMKNIVIGSSSKTSPTTLPPSSQTPQSSNASTMGSLGRQAAATKHTLAGGNKQTTLGSVPWNKPTGIGGTSQNSMTMAKPSNPEQQMRSSTGQQQQTRQNSFSISAGNTGSSQNSMSMAKQTSVISSTRSSPQSSSSGSPAASQQQAKVNIGARQTIDLTKNGAKVGGGNHEVRKILLHIKILSKRLLYDFNLRNSCLSLKRLSRQTLC